MDEIANASQNDDTSEGSGFDDFEGHGYVVVVSDLGKSVLVKAIGSDQIIVHSFESDHCSEYTSRMYRSDFAQSFGVQGHSHIIGVRTFSQTCHIRLVVVEMTRVDELKEPFSWIDVNRALLSVEKMPIQQIRVFLHTLLLLKRVTQATEKAFRSWYEVGYYLKARSWIEEGLGEQDFEITGTPEQLRCTPDSVVYSIPVQSDQMFFKACAEGSGEALRSEAIVSLFPEHTDTLVAVNKELEAFVTIDHGMALEECLGPPFMPIISPGYENYAVFEEVALREWASIQIRSVAHTDRLRKAGNMDVHDAIWMRQGFDDLVRYVEQSDGFFEDVYDLLSSRGALDRCLEQWEASGISKTLVHGDMFGGNVCQPGGPGNPFVFFDWDCAVVGYPFLEFRDPEMFRMFKYKAGYLESWRQYADSDTDTIRQLLECTRGLVELRDTVLMVRDTATGASEKREEVRAYLKDYLDEYGRAKDQSMLTVDNGDNGVRKKSTSIAAAADSTV